ncbi:MAG TPA: ABC transporter substrate-binding protein, partial [Dyella sp.]
MLRSLALATAIAFGSALAAPAFAQNAAPAPAADAAQQTPAQVVQIITDQLSKAIEGHQQELK